MRPIVSLFLLTLPPDCNSFEKMYKLLQYFPIILCLLLSTACSRQKNWKESNGSVWNTTYHIVYRTDKNLNDSIQFYFNSISQSVSVFNAKSTVSRINRNETTATDTMFRTLFRTATKINRESEGVFDPTVSPLINIWGYGYTPHTDSIPDDSMVEQALQSVGIDHCHIAADGTITKKAPETEFNFSALAKGFGCDEIGRMFQRNGCTEYMIEIGGEIAVHGTNPHDRTWRILIDAPVDNNQSPTHVGMLIIRVTDCGIASSGNYRNYRDTPKGRTSHTISPRTGYPITLMASDTTILSATVIAPTTTEADALATACMCMTPAKALRMIEADRSRSALLVISTSDDKQPQTIQTPNFPKSEQ